MMTNISLGILDFQRRVSIDTKSPDIGAPATDAAVRREEAEMATDPRSETLFALHRFGFGPRPGSVAAIAGDPRGTILAELDRPGATQLAAGQLPGSSEAARK